MSGEIEKKKHTKNSTKRKKLCESQNTLFRVDLSGAIKVQWLVSTKHIKQKEKNIKLWNMTVNQKTQLQNQKQE